MRKSVVGYVAGSDKESVTLQIKKITEFIERYDGLQLVGIFIDDNDCKDVLRDGIQGLLYHLWNIPESEAVITTSCFNITDKRWDFPWGEIDLQTDETVAIVKVNRDRLPNFLGPRMI